MGEKSPAGASFLPFVTSVTTDIYERIDKIARSLDTVTGLIQNVVSQINENLKKSADGIEDLIQQGEMNKQMTLEAFADSMNTLAKEIRTIRNENIEALQSVQTQELINAITLTATNLESRMYDIQTAFLINGIHALINAIKTGRVIGIPVPVRGAVASGAARVEAAQDELAAPMPSLSATEESGHTEKRAFFGKGARKKTHDEIMEEKRKKERLFGKYLK